MAKQKRSSSPARRAYASATSFTRNNRRAIGIAGAGLAGAAAALFFGSRYRDRQAQWAEDDVVGMPAI